MIGISSPTLCRMARVVSTPSMPGIFQSTITAKKSQEILGMTGLSIEVAENGKIALDMVSSSADGYYDLVFMDIQMPVMNGYEAAQGIRGLGRAYTDRLPIIAMTANAFAEDVVMAKDVGMNEHIATTWDSIPSRISFICIQL